MTDKIKLAAAVKAGDGEEARKYADVSDPAYQPFVEQAVESIKLAAQFKRIFRQIYGDAAADALPEFVRPEHVPADAPTSFAADGVIVTVPTRDEPTTANMNLGRTWDVPMVKVGEDSGALPDMLNDVTEYYEEEVQSQVQAITSMIEPALIVGLGAVVLVVILGIYLPIFGLSKAAAKGAEKGGS